jgi:hypothetical protein
VEIPLTGDLTLIHTKATKVTPAEDVYYLLFTKRRRIVLVTSGNLEVRQEEGMQTLRALSKWLMLEQGWIPMHSACVAKDGRAICVTGAKASGKTSTLLNLMGRNRCDLVATDKFLIRDAGPPLEICGVPGKAGIRAGSAIVHPQLQDWLVTETGPFFPHISAQEQLRNRKEKINMLPTELTELFGTSITPMAPLALVLVPVFDLGVEESQLVRASPEQAVTILMECYAGLLSKGEGFLQPFFDLSDARLQERLALLLRRLLPEVETYALYQNHQTNEQTAKLVAGLLA